jgi:ComF family protein
MRILQDIKESFFHFLFPHICAGCGSDTLSHENTLCIRCMDSLPETSFEHYENNPVERKFSGRLPLRAASAQYYFTRESLMQQLVHQFKYKGNQDLGFQLGRWMGASLKESERFPVDALVPLPLFPSRERKRGYNQATVLCEGIAEELKVPVLNHSIARPQHTDTQTYKGRIDRWKNIEGKFVLSDPESITGKHLLLVDDVITTGATLESCGAELLKADKVELSLACLCFTSR